MVSLSSITDREFDADDEESFSSEEAFYDNAEEESDVQVEEEDEEHSAGEAKSDEASEMEVEESSSSASSVAPVSAAGALGDESIRVFEDEDRAMVSERTAIIFEQMSSRLISTSRKIEPNNSIFV